MPKTAKNQKKKSVTDGWTDRRTDRRTDGPTKRGVESRSTRLKRLSTSNNVRRIKDCVSRCATQPVVPAQTKSKESPTIALRATDLRFSLESNCSKKSTSQLLLFINRCHVFCSQQKISDYSKRNR